jgi:hypothetical protein
MPLIEENRHGRTGRARRLAGGPSFDESLIRVAIGASPCGTKSVGSLRLPCC